MLRAETEFKINAIIDFLKSNKKVEYTKSFNPEDSRNELNFSIYSTGEMLEIVTNVNLYINYPFFDFNQFKNLNVTMEKPLYISIKKSE